MALLFQNFVYNFLKLERKDLSVFRENISWKIDPGSVGDSTLLPIMRTDISVMRGQNRTIIDTKYYREMFSSFYGSQKFSSENLYQMFSYLANTRRSGEEIEGVLLYPRVNHYAREEYSILGFKIRIETVDLGQPWETIGNALRNLIPV